MNTKNILHTALPYLLIALAFAASAALVTHGMPGDVESQVLASLSQLATGAVPEQSPWAATHMMDALLILPVYRLCMLILGDTAGIVMLMRIVFAALSFALALGAYKLLSRRLGSTAALLMSLGFLLTACSGAEAVAPYGLCVVIGFAAFACALEGWFIWREDDGTQTGYARVLTPLGTGFFGLTAAFCSPVAALVYLCIAALFFLTSYRQREKPALWMLAWVGAGSGLALVVLLFAASGFENSDAFMMDLVDMFLGLLEAASSPAGIACLLALAAGAVFFLNVLTHGEDGGRAQLLSAAAFLVFGGAAFALPLVVDASGERTALEYGCCSGLEVNAEELAAYEDMEELLGKVDEGSICIAGSSQWGYLEAAQGYAAPGEATWVLACIGSEYEGGDGYLPFAHSGQGTLYKHTSEVGSITQG